MMAGYTYKVLREYPDGSRAKSARTVTRFQPLRVGGLYVHLGKGFPGMQRVIAEVAQEHGNREGQGC